jgi:8-oxo-dGTP diphosphatase
MINRFNIRVYGLLIHNGQLLTVNELIAGNRYTKFPGGGLEFGEGIADCIIREFKEETSLDITINSHFYTTDFFQPSAFKHTDQVISIYYLVSAHNQPLPVHGEERTFTINDRTEQLTFFWIPLNELTADFFPLPIDKHVCKLLKQQMI